MHVFNRSKKKAGQDSPHSETEPDEQLVALVAAGDFGAYGRLIRRHQVFVNGMAFTLTNDRKRAGELAIAVLLLLWNERDKLNSATPIPNYLLELIIRLSKRDPPYLSDN
jgi:hypothetical protein